MAKKGTTKSTKQATAKKPKATKRTKVDLDALVADAKTTIIGTDYQAYLRNRLKGNK